MNEKFLKFYFENKLYLENPPLKMKDFINFTNREFFYLEEDRHELNWCKWAFPIITRVDSLKEIEATNIVVKYLG